MSLESVDLGTRSILGIAAGGGAYFLLGGLWYMALFRERWTAATGRTPEEFKDGSPGAGMLLSLVGCLVSAAVLAIVYHWGGGETLMDGLAVGGLLGAGVAAMEGMKAAIYNFDDRVRPWALYAINSAYTVSGLLLAGGVFALIA